MSFVQHQTKRGFLLWIVRSKRSFQCSGRMLLAALRGNGEKSILVYNIDPSQLSR